LLSTNQFLADLKKTLVIVAQKTQYEDLIKNGYAASFIKHSLQIFEFFTKSEHLQDFMATSAFELFLQVCLPMIRINKDERE